MPEPFCQQEPSTDAGRAFVVAVTSEDAVAVDRLLAGDTDLRAAVDAPWFAFDSPAVVEAARCACLPVVDALLAHGARIDVRSSWWAGGFGVLDHDETAVAEALVGRGAAVDANAAARHGWLDRLETILSRDPAQADAPGGDGQRPLHVAATPAIVNRLLAAGATIDARDLDHVATPAQYAVDERPEVCRHLIERGATPDIFLACAFGDPELAGRVLAAEPDALASRLGHCPHTRETEKSGGHIYNWRLRGTSRPLVTAAAFGHDALFDALWHQAAPADRLLAAAWQGDGARVRQVCAEHPGLVASLPPADACFIAQAAWHGRLEAVRVMLDAGFDAKVQDDEGQTPLHAAAFHGFTDLVALLLARDSAPPLEVTNRYGGTALGCARYGAVHGWRDDGDHPATILLLLEAGALLADDAPPTGRADVDTVIDRFRSATA